MPDIRKAPLKLSSVVLASQRQPNTRKTQNPLVRAQNYRVRAEELRSIRESWRDPETREILGRVAADYDRMADHLEKMVEVHPPKHN